MLVALSAAVHVTVVAQEAKDIMTSEKHRSALVVVDAQVGVLGTAWDSKRVIGNIEALVSKARRSGTPVLWVQHSDHELKQGSEAWKLIANFKPEPAEPVVHKKYNSSFADTDLDAKLKQLGITRLALAGAATNWCIRSTAYSALERGYDLVVVSDGHSTENLEPREGKLIPAADIIEEFNTVMRWICVPRVKVEVMSTGEVAF